MERAIHKITGLPISAYRLETDATWIGKQKDEFIVPTCDTLDFKEKGEAKAFFTKSHTRELDGIIIPVVAHFKTESERLIYDYENESEAHQLAKKGIYEAICNGTIKLEGNPLKNLMLDIAPFEVKIGKSTHSKIADVLVLFKQWHPIYGKGVIFEVQLSKQSMEITEDRTYDRLAEGFSIVWLWDGDFENNKIKLERINYIPYAEAIKLYLANFENKSILKVNEAGLALDNKIKSLSLKYQTFEEDLANQSKIVTDAIIDGFREELSEIDAFNRAKINSVKEIMNKEVNLKEEILQGIKESKIEINTIIKENVNFNNIERDIIDEVHNEISNKLNIQTLNVFPPEWIKSIIKKVLEDKVDSVKLKEDIVKTLSTQKTELNVDIVHSCKCKKCSNLFSINSMEYEGGSPYCFECFNSLETNWQKRAKKDIPNKIYELK